jgi:hypothetical protein
MLDHDTPQRVYLASPLQSYCKYGRNAVGGWFTKFDAHVFAYLLSAQSAWGMKGAVAEIGVHHGKSFLALCLGRTSDERALCIDIFDDQQHNKDHSGSGNESIFRRNLAKHAISLDRVSILKRSSLDITANDVRDAVGPVRFFSVDGGHWLEIVKNDLEMASQSLMAGGVIALDDYSHPDWPEVALGFHDWYTHSDGSVVPFAITPSKLYLASREWAARYSDLIYNTPATHHLYKKTTPILGHDTRVFTPYSTYVGRAKQLLMNKNEKLYGFLKGLSSRSS